ncbi:MauE/DoxX family redox-associated membrane protein [Thalassobacillus sp. C254]|uniref:MauE/DoxX family redox-associated membrane protein n=1 Tax=Thalassobacillus sp. C254 TaxID=1225341 RepID=UPI0006CF7D87|nr:MauE/DoxX family redox-associated membrane protein [Thalassobacillus sp. C254]
MDVVFLSILCCLSSFFIISALTKLSSLRHFIKLNVNVAYIPTKYRSFFLSLLPFLELAGALLLVNRRTFFLGWILVTVLLLLFLIHTIVIVLSRKSVTCGCYGKYIKSRIDHFTLLKTSFLLFLSGLILPLVFLEATFWGFTPAPFLLGLSLTLILLISQIAWTSHQETMMQIKKK